MCAVRCGGGAVRDQFIENPAGGEADEFIGCFAFELDCRRMFK